MYFTTYPEHNLDAVHAMLMHDATVTGLSDAGAHVSVIFDAVAPTYQLTHWVRDRTRGPRLPLEHMVHRQTLKNARLFGFRDRGSLESGKRADVNVIDFAGLALGELKVHRDLPAGGIRLLQPASGYVGTWVNGVRTRERDADTMARPGRLLRSTG
jgi:N-acyl-D-aspartate/D-glutamate deacylase